MPGSAAQGREGVWCVKNGPRASKPPAKGRPRLSPLARQIGKKAPFESLEQEAFLNMYRTCSALTNELVRSFRAFGLSPATYNVLRILRGAGEPRACSQVREHLVTAVPDLTRLIDRLHRAGLVTKQRGMLDGRNVLVGITPKGKALLARMDGPVLDLHRVQLGHMGQRDLRALNRLLVIARDGRRNSPHPAPS